MSVKDNIVESTVTPVFECGYIILNGTLSRLTCFLLCLLYVASHARLITSLSLDGPRWSLERLWNSAALTLNLVFSARTLAFLLIFYLIFFLLLRARFSCFRIPWVFHTCLLFSQMTCFFFILVPVDGQGDATELEKYLMLPSYRAA